jgi:hypothetical protein
VFLAALPSVVAARRRVAVPTVVAVVSVAAWTAAAVGRRRHGGRRVFPARAVWWAPVWLLERSVPGPGRCGGRRCGVCRLSSTLAAELIPLPGGGDWCTGQTFQTNGDVVMP